VDTADAPRFWDLLISGLEPCPLKEQGVPQMPLI
jgi:hypothetical protein